MKFRKKPVVIDAVCWTGDNDKEVLELASRRTDVVRTPDGKIVIHTLDGHMTADRGDWIIRGVAGELYLCKPDIFQKMYERTEDDDA